MISTGYIGYVDGYEYGEARGIASRLLARVHARRPDVETTETRMKELSDCRVLIVDDVKANVDILVQALQR